MNPLPSCCQGKPPKYYKKKTKSSFVLITSSTEDKKATNFWPVTTGDDVLLMMWYHVKILFWKYNPAPTSCSAPYERSFCQKETGLRIFSGAEGQYCEASETVCVAFGGVDIRVWSVGVQHRPRWNKTVIHPIKRKVEHSGGRSMIFLFVYFCQCFPPTARLWQSIYSIWLLTCCHFPVWVSPFKVWMSQTDLTPKQNVNNEMKQADASSVLPATYQ